MSIALPIFLPSDGFIADLLHEQHSLTAVERFSEVHGSHEHIQARYYRDLLPSSPPRPGFQFAFEVDLDKCSGCKACVVACHSMNGLDDDEVWRRVGTTTTAGPLGRIQHVTTACHHCEEPGCLLGCPVKAYDKDPVTGIVRHLDDQCIGCKYCMMMCPYEVPQYSKRLGIVRKCDMCHQRLSAGEAPACVQGCPNEAIAIREVMVGESLDFANSKLAPDAPDSSITRPTTRYQTARAEEFYASTPQDVKHDHVAESHWPLAIMLVATQASVGLIFAERWFALTQWLIGASSSDAVTRVSALVALALAVVGLNLASLHLGQPLRAWRVFLGLRTSWLSREAIILGQYVGVLAAAVALLWYPMVQSYLPAKVNELAGWIPNWAAGAALNSALLIGIAGLASSAMIYVATKRKMWRMSRTMTRFLASGIVTGIAFLLPVLAYTSESISGYLVAAVITCLFVVAKLGLDTRLYLFANSTDEDRRSSLLSLGPMKSVVIIRIALGLVSLLLVAASAGTLAGDWNWTAVAIAATAATGVLAGEFAERTLYFTTVVYDRMPGTLR